MNRATSEQERPDGWHHCPDCPPDGEFPDCPCKCHDFKGCVDRECGDHRTTGRRAWCFSCQEWCYPEIPCKGCEIPQLREEVAKLKDVLGRKDPDIRTTLAYEEGLADGEERLRKVLDELTDPPAYSEANFKAMVDKARKALER